MKKNKISPLVLSAAILAFAILISTFMFVSQEGKKAQMNQAKENQYELCLAEADAWYKQNASLLPTVCEQDGISEDECSKLLEATIKGRDKLRNDCAVKKQ